MKKWIPVAVIGGLVLIIGVSLIGRYNKLVEMSETVDGSWAQVANVLQRRADLIPNMVATVKGYATHEEKVFTDIADARAKLAGARGPEQSAAANDQLSGALARLLVVAENYPQLKANEQFRALQDELAGTENRIAVERKRYNDVVRDFNASTKKFPGNLVAGMFGFQAKPFFEADAGAKQVPKVAF
jgi:LemA protein